MKLVSFRIKNYKSIKDSGECYVQDKLTIFAGKNGSGKSNVLEALYKFSTQEFDFEEDTYNYAEDVPIITNTYELEETEISEIKDKYNIQIGKKVIIELDTQDNEEYGYTVVFDYDWSEIKEKNKKTINYLKKEVGIEEIEYSDSVDGIIDGKTEEEQATIKECLSKVEFIDILEEKEKIEDYILEKMPQFVYQKTIENELKSIITQESIKTNDFHKDISKLMKLKADDFNPALDKSKRTRRSSKLTNELTGDFGAFYSQDKIELKFSLDADSIVMDVIEPDKASKYENKIENKSDGLKWFIAFYTKLNVIKNKQVIILLDEPGMYLHAKACSEMLKIFDDISKESQILLATHNPYLIQADNIGSVRLVLNEKDESTIIENKPHKYNQDKNMDALTPILTSIGYELTMSIHVGDQKNNVITEGISDYYFLQAMLKVLNKTSEFLIIPSSSADKINYIGSILIGWGLNTIALLDSDSKGKKKEQELNQLLDKCIFVSSEPNLSIEDLFTKEEYCKKILELDEVLETINSKTKKDLKIDEVLKAKQFYEKAKDGTIEISEETKSRFKDLFKEITEGFKSIIK